MQKLIVNWVFAIAVFAIAIQKSTAQTDSCIVKLKNADNVYEQGDYDGTIKLLQSALSECKLSKEEKIQTKKLLIMSYLKVDNLEEADRTAGEIMRIDPRYEPDKFKDDPKLSALFEKYKPVPIFKIGFSGGFNMSKVDQVKTYSMSPDYNAEELGYYTNKPGWQLGAWAEYRAYKNLWAGLGIRFRETTYVHILDSIENSSIHYKEKLSYIDLPLSAKYYIIEKKLSPYIEGGVDFSFLTGALSTTTHDEVSDLVNRRDFRNTFTIGYFGGAGVVYKLKSIQLCLNVGYHYYPENVNKEGTRNADPVNVFKYEYIDDDFRVDNFQVNVGVNYIISFANQKVK